MQHNDKVKIKILTNKNNSWLPAYQTSGSSGLDLKAANDEPINIKTLERVLLPTGLKVVIPHGYEGQIRPRSGLALKHGITCLNSPGTIDSDYRGEIKVLIINFGQETYQIKPGQRIAQLVICPIAIAEIYSITEMDETNRGEGGFGHTGTR